MLISFLLLEQDKEFLSNSFIRETQNFLLKSYQEFLFLFVKNIQIGTNKIQIQSNFIITLNFEIPVQI